MHMVWGSGTLMPVSKVKFQVGDRTQQKMTLVCAGQQAGKVPENTAVILITRV